MDDSVIREGIEYAIEFLEEEERIYIPPLRRNDFIADCVYTAIEWIEQYDHNPVMSEEEYAKIVMDIAKIYEEVENND